MEELKIIPYRILENLDESDIFNEVYEFLIKSNNSKDIYKILIFKDDFNEIGINKWKCNCTDYKISTNENCKRFKSKEYKCKHIKHCINLLCT